MFGMLCSELVVGVWSLAQLFYLFSSQCVVSGVNVKRKSRYAVSSHLSCSGRDASEVEVSEGWALEERDVKGAGRNG